VGIKIQEDETRAAVAAQNAAFSAVTATREALMARLHQLAEQERQVRERERERDAITVWRRPPTCANSLRWFQW
jgi:hypothetical protein